MEAYFLFHSGMAHDAKVACAEQEEDIGSPSDSESASTSRSRESAAGSSSELDDDAASSTSSSGGSDGRFEMSALMTQLPLKRGLSRFFDGKSQSFASLAAVGSLEDLPKPARKRLKPSRSCGGALNAHHRGRLLSPRRHCAKPAAAAAARKAAARTGALSVLAAVAPRVPPPVARPQGVPAKVLIVN